jgi:hypothetical protein
VECRRSGQQDDHGAPTADEWGNIGIPKSHGGQRTVPLSPIVLNTLKEWKLACPKTALDLVFPNGAGNVERPQNLTNRFWRPLQRKAGLVDESGEPLFDACGAPLRGLSVD